TLIFSFSLHDALPIYNRFGDYCFAFEWTKPTDDLMDTTMMLDKDASKKFTFAEGEVLLVDKPLTWTSFDVVGKLRNTMKPLKLRSEEHTSELQSRENL